MEKKNTLVITILAVVVLLVLVLTATFAYFAAQYSGNGNTGNVINVNATLPESNSKFIVGQTAQLSVNVNAADMVNVTSVISNDNAKGESNANLTITVGGGTAASEGKAASPVGFTYDLVFAWDKESASEAYIYATPGMDNTTEGLTDPVDKEITLQIAFECSSTDTTACSDTKTTKYELAETNIASTTGATATSGLKGILDPGANTVTLATGLQAYAAGVDTTITYTATVRIYNTSLDQSSTSTADTNYVPIAGKTYTGKIYVDNVSTVDVAS